MKRLSENDRAARVAMRWSLWIGFGMLVGKVGAWWWTGSAAILSDAAESVIHVIAVGFASFSLRLSQRPANASFLYGYERISYFSAGFEGGMIVLAAIAIIAAAVQKWISGIELVHLSGGTAVVVAASLINAALGWYLLRAGRRLNSIILEANGKHVLTDCWTSFGVVLGLGLVMVTGWKPFDPLCAILVALNILWSGSELIFRSARGLLDYADPEMGRRLRDVLDRLAGEIGLEYHGVRFRETGQRMLVEVHLLFPFEMPLGEAHRRATLLEEGLVQAMDKPCEVITHLESVEDHQSVHQAGHYTGRP